MKEELLQKYFLEDLSPEENATFNRLLEEDADFKEHFEFEKSIQKVTRQSKREDYKAKLGIFEKELLRKTEGNAHVSYKSTTEPTSKSNPWKFIGIAASLILIAALGWIFFQNPSTDKLYAENYNLYPNTVVSIERGDGADDSLEREAFAAYEKAEYSEAIAIFQKLSAENPAGYLVFYQAQSYLAMGELTKALPLFQETSSSKEEYEAESLWYEALIHLKMEDADAATITLQKLIDNGTYKKAQSQELLKELE